MKIGNSELGIKQNLPLKRGTLRELVPPLKRGAGGIFRV
jgi:hypothetical protein